jgi:hypothetical protein
MASTQVDAGTGRPFLPAFPTTDEAPPPGSPLLPFKDAHAAAPIVVEDCASAERKFAADPLSSEQGRAVKARETVVELEGRLAKFGPLLEAGDKKVVETRANLLRRAAKPFDTLRGLTIAAWARDTKVEEKGRLIARAIELNDLETIVAAVTAPPSWVIFPDARWRERAERALLEATDSKALAELDALERAIHSVREAHHAARDWIRKRAGIALDADLAKKEKQNE